MPALSLVMFGLLYNISFLASPPATTGRMALLALMLAYRKEIPGVWSRLIAQVRIPVALVGIVTIYAAAQWVLVGSGDSTQLSRVLNFMLYVVGGAVAVTAASGGSLRRMAMATALATCVQALAIIGSFFSPTYKDWLGGVLVQSGNIAFTAALQAPGFSNSSGALLSVTQAMGVFVALLLLTDTDAPRPRAWLLTAAILCLVSTVLSGRTGLQLSLLFFFGFAVLGGPWSLLRFTAAGVASLVLLIGWFSALEAWVTQFNPAAGGTFAWAFEFFVSGTATSSLTDFISQDVPRLTIETILGTGRVLDATGLGNASGHDSGYIQAYYSLGLPMSTLLYGALLGLFLGAMQRLPRHRSAALMLLGLAFVIEIKEPFMFKYAMPFILLTLALHLGTATSLTRAEHHA
jgi:hypothetical protein